MQALKYWVEKDTTSFFKEVKALLPYLDRQSNLLQFCILEMFVPHIRQLSNIATKQKLLNHLSNYYINHLELDFSTLNHHSQLKLETVYNS